MPVCLDCGETFYNDAFQNERVHERLCPKCIEKMNKRSGFRKIMNQLEEISKLDRNEASYMSGFSYAEMERFSLIMKKVVKRFHFPEEDEDFVHSPAKKKLQELKEAIYF